MGVLVLHKEAVLGSGGMPILVDSLLGIIVIIPIDILVEVLVVGLDFGGG